MERKGIRLNIVRDGGQAAASGLESGDILLSYGDTELTSADQLSQAISCSTGSSIIRFIRAGKLRSTEANQGSLGIAFAEVDVEIQDTVLAQELDGDSFERRISNSIESMIVTTAPSVEGSRVTKQLGVISAECVFGLNVFKDFFSAVTDIVGGRSKTTQAALREARETCISELKREAAMRGANAVIAVDLDYSEFSGQGKSMLFLVATGTAVFIEQ